LVGAGGGGGAGARAQTELLLCGSCSRPFSIKRESHRAARRRPNHTSILVLIAKFIYRYPRDWPRALSEGKPR